MAYVNLNNVTLAFGGVRLFDNIGLCIEEGEKIALVGRNGSGKSTLLKIIAGLLKPDSGDVALRKGLRCAYLEQMVPDEIPGTVFDIVSSGLALRQPHELESEWEKQQQVEKVTFSVGIGWRTDIQFAFSRS